MIIYGKIAVLEALKSEKTFNKLLIEKGLKDKTVQEIISTAKENGVKIDFVAKERNCESVLFTTIGIATNFIYKNTKINKIIKNANTLSFF